MARLSQALVLGIVILAIAASFTALAAGDNDAQKATLKVEHSVDGTTWKPRGQVSYRAGTALLSSDFASGTSIAKVEQDQFTARDLVNLEQLAQNGGLYRVRVPVATNSYVSASVPACQLLASGFSDEIDVHMSGSKIIGVSYHVASSKCVSKNTAGENARFHTRATVKYAEDTPRPNLDPLGTGHAQQSPASPPAGAAKEEPVDDRSFIAKYWHYLLPIPVMLLLLVGMVPGGGGDKK